MNILIIAGHGDGDSGAVSNGYQEQYLTREFAKLVVKALQKYECNVELAPDSRNYYKYLQQHGFNYSNYDYMLEIHFNSGGGTGTEIFITTNTKGFTVESNIVKNLSSTADFKNRGVKKKNWYVISKFNSYGVDSALLEVCFIDNKNDILTYECKKEDMALSVAKGIASGFGIKERVDNTMQIAELEKRITAIENRLSEFNYIDKNMSDSYKPTIKRLVDKGLLKGDEKGELHLTVDMMRILTILDRGGVFGAFWEHEIN